MFFFLILILALCTVGAVDTCQDEFHQIGECPITYKVCNHVQGGQIQYQSDANDESSPEDEHSDWYPDAQDAVNESTGKWPTT